MPKSPYGTGLLDFYDDNTNIQGLYFIGPHLRPAVNDNFAEDEEFIETNLIYDTFEQIKNPIKNGVYTIIDKDSIADTSQLSTQGLDITSEDLSIIANLAAPVITQDALLLSDQLYNWLDFARANSAVANISRTEQFYIENLSYSQKQIFINLLYQAILKQYIDSGNKYIYYHGGWYPFTETNDVVIPSIQAIVDYYCTILRKRY